MIAVSQNRVHSRFPWAKRKARAAEEMTITARIEDEGEERTHASAQQAGKAHTILCWLWRLFQEQLL